MPRMENKAVPEGNGLVPQQEESGSNEPTLLADFYRLLTKDSIDGTGSLTRWRKIGEVWISA